MFEKPKFFVGTASWTDHTLVKSDLFYPPEANTAEARLRFYVTHFNTVEVDSSFYALPSERNSELRATRTPNDFVFNIKAFALLTQHAADASRLPKAIKEILPAAMKSESRIKSPPREVLDLSFEMFWSALSPLREADKLGRLVFQFPPYFTYRRGNFDYLAGLRSRMSEATIAVEFRHPSWVGEEPQRVQTLRFLREHDLAYISIDAPPGTGLQSLVEATASDAYVRFHGRNRENWFKRNQLVAERYKYLYSEAELADWADKLKQLTGVRRAFAVFNNCYSNFGIMNATTMSQILTH
jgi:uncharacterized protein YecE (DUF72 family)